MEKSRVFFSNLSDNNLFNFTRSARFLNRQPFCFLIIFVLLVYSTN